MVIFTYGCRTYLRQAGESTNGDVWFDDLTVELYTPEVTEETDYYPFGHILSQWKRDSQSNYRFGYQGEFSEEDDETGWNQFELRMYDAIIGRWISIDPMRQPVCRQAGIGVRMWGWGMIR